jgi:ankyrin repeat protein
VSQLLVRSLFDSSFSLHKADHGRNVKEDAMSAQTPRNLNLTQLKREAKELRDAHRAGDRSACSRLQNHLPPLADSTDTEIKDYAFSLREAQSIIARENGFESWAVLKHHVEKHAEATTVVKDQKKTPYAILYDVTILSPEQITKFWESAFISEEHRALTPVEEAFIDTAVIPGKDRWSGSCNVTRMKALVRQDPGILQSIGPALVNITLSTRGCATALHYLLENNVPFLIEEYRQREGKQYDAMHEAAWAGCTDNLRVLFEAGVADAAGTSNPHTGWPDNVSLLYWPAFYGTVHDGVALTRLLLDYGADPEVKFKGNGERGNTALQEAVSPGHDVQWRDGKRELARTLITHGAYYDVYSACALDDLDRVQQCAATQPDLAFLVGEANMTPLHWAARSGAHACMAWLLEHRAPIDAITKFQRTPLHLCAESGTPDSIRLLHAHGADLDAQDRKGRTPLHRATYEGSAATAEALLAVGADPMVLTKTGKNAFEIARKDAKYLKEKS